MSDDHVLVERQGDVARITLNRPEARNALTIPMYERLRELAGELATEPGLRVVVLRGAGGKAFAAGTDIAHFRSFSSGEDGIAYERRIDGCIEALASLPLPTLAVIEGYAVGGGLAIAAACDLRIATPDARFGIPIARTLGNCLSAAGYARLVQGFGVGRAKRMLFLSQMIEAEEALAAGFVVEIAARDALDARVDAVVQTLAEAAPVTLAVTKAALDRLARQKLPDIDDLVRKTYGSEDFADGVAAFLARRKPAWRGR
jgi:enoyl-CoA hydratase/carnithine racemase